MIEGNAPLAVPKLLQKQRTTSKFSSTVRIINEPHCLLAHKPCSCSVLRRTLSHTQTMFVFILPFLVHLAAGGNTSPDIPKENYNTNWTGLLTFLGTNQEIWLRKTNQEVDNMECIRWQRSTLKNNTYDFDKWSRRRGVKLKRPRRAKLINVTKDKEEPAMNILYNAERESQGGELYILRYLGWSETCAIFELPGQKWAEYVWRPNVEKTPVCDAAYQKFASWSYQVFLESCLREIRVCVGPTRC
uniref:Lipocalin n=1 Tax=Rhipicephalus appendiculatus TaxID=34631 RepID=A0A131YSG5_RHIAP